MCRSSMKVYICVGFFLSLGILPSAATTEQEIKDSRTIIETQEYPDPSLNITSIIEQILYRTLKDTCETCNFVPNTVCNSSELIPLCKCIDNYFPINGEALNGCRDPCNEVKNRNNLCIPVSDEVYECRCNDGHFPMFEDDTCSGCLDPCRGFKVRNADCSPLSLEDFNCRCKEGHVPMYDDNPCFGCIIDCSVHDGYIFYENFGCLKNYDNGNVKTWESARAVCLQEGGDLFTPGHKLPLLPAKLQLLTHSNVGYWTSIRRYSRGPFKRLSGNDQSELQEDSPLWREKYPKNEYGRDCIDYGSQTKLLYNDKCDLLRGTICQILKP